MMANLNLTDAQIREIAAYVKTIICAESKSLGDVPVVSVLEGVTTLPALRNTGTLLELVRAPLELLGSGTAVDLSRIEADIKSIIGTTGGGTEIFDASQVKTGYIDEAGNIITT